MQAFPVRLPSGATYWTVVDDDLAVVPEPDAYLHHLRFGADAAESTTESYARALALYVSWCARTGQDWASGERLGSFMTWLQHSPSKPDQTVVAGPGIRPVRRERRVNFVLTVVRGFLRHGVDTGTVAPEVLSRLYTLSDDRHLPPELRGEGRELRYWAKARHLGCKVEGEHLHVRRRENPKRPAARSTKPSCCLAMPRSSPPRSTCIPPRSGCGRPSSGSGCFDPRAILVRAAAAAAEVVVGER